ncbi:MAG TPA: methyltransferase domain-containing protein [Candidatus Acidoferrales bacterium]|nr:methyltransferase domain-containing protein [Candidatus Acidoferrales bacterium]
MSFQLKFGQAADEFQRYRPEYPPSLFERILCEVPPDRRHCAMDLGAGTGKVTGELIAHFEEVIAVEPDPLMAAKIREQFSGVVLRISTAEELTQPPSTADLIIIATAFHWMDGPRVLANAATWLRAAGILAIFDLPFPTMPDPVRVIVKKELKERWAAFRDPRLNKAGRWQDVVRSATGLDVLEEGKFANIVPMSSSDLAGFCRSTSYGSAFARSLPDPESYWRELESRFRAAWPDGMIPVDFSPTLILARKI